jgi:hypothetical protein
VQLKDFSKKEQIQQRIHHSKKHQPYHTEEIFFDYLPDDLMLFVISIRVENHLENESGCLFIDNAKCHSNQRIQELLAKNNNKFISIHPLTTKVFQF